MVGKAVCPNDPEHKRFTTTAHVMQLWEVDEEGNFLDMLEEFVQVLHGPDRDNIWTCCECGTKAVFQ